MKTIYIENIKNINLRKARRIAKKLYKINKKEDVVVALSKNLNTHKELNEIINNYGINILDGRWLFKFLLPDILEYISKNNNKSLATQNVAILMDNIDEIVMKQIDILAKKVKVLKIITLRKNSFSYIEEKLYNEYGIAIQITNNKQKSLLGVNIIINIDFSKEKINEYNIESKATIVNINEEIDLDRSKYKGKIINEYKIRYNKENFQKNMDLKEFNDNILYESYIYRKDTFENIKKQLHGDDVKIIKLL